MPKRHPPVTFDQKAIRNWTLYVVKFRGGHYYVGITSYKDFMRRINQHGGRRGARVNRGQDLEEIIEVRPLGRMSGQAAGQIENDVTLQYRKKFGAHKVRGGYDITTRMPLIPTYTPGSPEAFIFIILSLVVALGILLYLLHE